MKKLQVIMMVCVLLGTCVMAQAKVYRFGVPPWPGVTVKSEVAMQIMRTLGYAVESVETSPAVIYNSIPQGELDIYMGGWIPQQNFMIEPLLRKKRVAVAATNLTGAMVGFAVPSYVWDAGVHSIADLAAHADSFESTVYNIEPGAAMHTAMEDVIAANGAGLGGWNHVGSTVPMMMAQVRSLIAQKKWVVFGAWKPHWMNELVDIKYLTASPETETLVNNSVVVTVVRYDFSQTDPNVFLLLSQICISTDIQNKWIHAFGYKKVPAERVAREWIAGNLQVVKGWLTGVVDSEGKSAFSRIQKEYSAKK